MRTRLIALLVVLVALAASCGVPKSSGFEPIPIGNIPEGLTETTTTTTTTTIVATTSTIPAVTATTIEPAPTTNPTEAVTLYFVAGQQLATSVQFLPSPVQTQVALAALVAGPDKAAVGLRTAIPPRSQFTPSMYRGVLTVDLLPTFFTSMADPADERLAVGQIVLTLTHLSGVSQVRFTMNDDPISVPLGDGTLSDPGRSLVIEDYEVLLGNSPPPSAPETTTTTLLGAPPNALPETTTTITPTTTTTTTAPPG